MAPDNIKPWRTALQTNAQVTGATATAPVTLEALLAAIEALEQDVRDIRSALQQLAARLDDPQRAPARAGPSVPTMSEPKRPPGVSPAGLEIHCFGKFEVLSGERSLPLSCTGKSAMILKYMAASGREPVPRDVLLTVLWPDVQPHIANNRLKVAMHHLRQAFAGVGLGGDAEQWILFHSGCYLFNPEANLWTDVAAFEEAWHTGMRLEHTGQLAAAIPFYMRAEALYLSDFLEEDRFEEWTLVPREHLRDTYLTILDKLCRYWLRTEYFDSAIEGWKKILARDPWREDAYRHLMACLAEKGNRGLALHWYELCVQVLKEQLGIEPEPETTALYERIRAGADIAAWLAA